MITKIDRPDVITGIVDVICFEDKHKPAQKIYSNFNNDFSYDTIDKFVEGLVESNQYELIRIRCYTNYD